MRKNAFWELLFRASPAAILGWVARAVISPERERADVAPHCRVPPTWGAHNHTEEKVEEGREVGFSVRWRGVGGVASRKLLLPPPLPRLLFLCFREGKSPAAARHRILESPTLLLNALDPESLSPPATGRVGQSAGATPVQRLLLAEVRAAPLPPTAGHAALSLRGRSSRPRSSHTPELLFALGSQLKGAFF